MRAKRLWSAALLAGILVAGTGAAWVNRQEPLPDDPAFRQPVPTTTTTTDATTTTTTSGTAAGTASGPVPGPVPQPLRPVDVPADPYFKEPLVEIGTIEIPKLGLTHRIFHGISLRTIDHGPSHWPGSAFPGQNGNAVFAGHRVTHSKPFRHIDQLVPGDQVFFTIGGTRSAYAVTGHEIVTPDGMHIVEPTPTPTATLFACHPPGSARYRYVVRLALVASPA